MIAVNKIFKKVAKNMNFKLLFLVISGCAWLNGAAPRQQTMLEAYHETELPVYGCFKLKAKDVKLAVDSASYGYGKKISSYMVWCALTAAGFPAPCALGTAALQYCLFSTNTEYLKKTYSYGLANFTRTKILDERKPLMVARRKLQIDIEKLDTQNTGLLQKKGSLQQQINVLRQQKHLFPQQISHLEARNESMRHATLSATDSGSDTD